MEIHLKIKEIREGKNIIQSYMAEKMDMSLVSYSKIERGITELSVKRLYKIAGILGVNVAELLGIEVLNNNQTEKIKELEKERDFYKSIVEMTTSIVKNIFGEKTQEEKDDAKERLSKLSETSKELFKDFKFTVD